MKVLRMEIDLDAAPTSSYGTGVSLKKHVRLGVMSVIEKRACGGVYINDRKLTLYQSERQSKGETISACDLLLEVESLLVCNATLNNFFKAHPDFVPEEWKRKDAHGTPVSIGFFGTEFVLEAGHERPLLVSFGWWNDGWNSDELLLSTEYQPNEDVFAVVSEN